MSARVRMPGLHTRADLALIVTQDRLMSLDAHRCQRGEGALLRTVVESTPDTPIA